MNMMLVEPEIHSPKGEKKNVITAKEEAGACPGTVQQPQDSMPHRRGASQTKGHRGAGDSIETIGEDCRTRRQVQW